MVIGCVWLGPGGTGYAASYGGNNLEKFDIANPNTNSTISGPPLS